MDWTEFMKSLRTEAIWKPAAAEKTSMRRGCSREPMTKESGCLGSLGWLVWFGLI